MSSSSLENKIQGLLDRLYQENQSNQSDTQRNIMDTQINQPQPRLRPPLALFPVNSSTSNNRRPQLNLPVSFQQNRNLETETDNKLREIQKLSGVLTINGQRYKTDISEMENITVLGTGTCGVVVKMRHIPSGEIIAVKQMRRSGNSEENKRIIMDIDVVLKSHDCPYIVKCLGCFITESDVWICMELMATCFDKLLKNLKTAIPENVLGKVTYATVKALSYLKEQHDVIHRDVKPSNILVDERGNVKLCDFGISGRLVDSMAKTRSAGCAAYMAPERIEPPNPLKPDYDIRADVWSLGITLVELATGVFPYKDCKTDFEVLTKVLSEDPPCLPEDQEFSNEFRAFVACCLIKNFVDRPKYVQLINHPFMKRHASQSDNPLVHEWFQRALRQAELLGANSPARRYTPAPSTTQNHSHIPISNQKILINDSNFDFSQKNGGQNLPPNGKNFNKNHTNTKNYYSNSESNDRFCSFTKKLGEYPPTDAGGGLRGPSYQFYDPKNVQKDLNYQFSEPKTISTQRNPNSEPQKSFTCPFLDPKYNEVMQKPKNTNLDLETLSTRKNPAEKDLNSQYYNPKNLQIEDYGAGSMVSTHDKVLICPFLDSKYSEVAQTGSLDPNLGLVSYETQRNPNYEKYNFDFYDNSKSNDDQFKDISDSLGSRGQFMDPNLDSIGPQNPNIQTKKSYSQNQKGTNPFCNDDLELSQNFTFLNMDSEISTSQNYEKPLNCEKHKFLLQKNIGLTQEHYGIQGPNGSQNQKSPKLEFNIGYNESCLTYNPPVGKNEPYRSCSPLSEISCTSYKSLPTEILPKTEKFRSNSPILGYMNSHDVKNTKYGLNYMTPTQSTMILRSNNTKIGNSSQNSNPFGTQLGSNLVQSSGSVSLSPNLNRTSSNYGAHVSQGTYLGSQGSQASHFLLGSSPNFGTLMQPNSLIDTSTNFSSAYSQSLNPNLCRMGSQGTTGLPNYSKPNFSSTTGSGSTLNYATQVGYQNLGSRNQYGSTGASYTSQNSTANKWNSPITTRKHFNTPISEPQYCTLNNTSPILLQRFFHQQKQLQDDSSEKKRFASHIKLQLGGVRSRHHSPEPPPRLSRGNSSESGPLGPQSPIPLRRNFLDAGNASPNFSRRYISSSPPQPPPRRISESNSVPGSPQHFRARLHYTPEPQRRVYRNTDFS